MLRYAHFETGRLARFMRDRYYPAVASPATGFRQSRGTLRSMTRSLPAVSLAALALRLTSISTSAFQAMAGDGVGRYGSSQLARHYRASEWNA